MTQTQAFPHARPSADTETLDLTFATTLAARLCHDLAGTMGALTGMLEMAADGGEPEAMALSLTCARELTSRLRLLRAAWSADGDVPELSSVLTGLPGAERLTVTLPPLLPGLTDAVRRLAANLLLVSANALPRGGTIRMVVEHEGLTVEIEGPRAAWPAALADCLADPSLLQAACTRSREVGLALACMMAAGAGLRLTLDGPTRLTARP